MDDETSREVRRIAGEIPRHVKTLRSAATFLEKVHHFQRPPREIREAANLFEEVSALLRTLGFRDSE